MGEEEIWKHIRGMGETITEIRIEQRGHSESLDSVKNSVARMEKMLEESLKLGRENQLDSAKQEGRIDGLKADVNGVGKKISEHVGAHRRWLTWAIGIPSAVMAAIEFVKHLINPKTGG